jgi:hypothetical protein
VNGQTKIFPVAIGLCAVGLIAFLAALAMGREAAAWQAYLVNFLLFSAIAQGAVVFSAMMNTVQAKWSGRLANLAESFSAFFPISFVLFLGLFLGRAHVFPWLHHELHGKAVWLNLPFLFSRDTAALLILYGLGFAYLYYALWFKAADAEPSTFLSRKLNAWWMRGSPDRETYSHRRYVFGVLYLLAFAIVLSLIGYDLVMAAEPHWYSTLFGAYCFIKSIYVGFGALIILAGYLHLSRSVGFRLSSSEFIDMGKLFFAFCLAWADFFYCQLVVIWYGNISEETAYVIARTVLAPWNRIAWAVFIVCFILPFLILLNRKIKTVPRFMMALCTLVIIGMWLEHYLLLGPALSGHGSGHGLPVSPVEGGVALGFAGLLMLAVFGYLRQFPDLLASGQKASE